jgi:hypothetical protein
MGVLKGHGVRSATFHENAAEISLQFCQEIPLTP